PNDRRLPPRAGRRGGVARARARSDLRAPRPGAAPTAAPAREAGGGEGGWALLHRAGAGQPEAGSRPARGWDGGHRRAPRGGIRVREALPRLRAREPAAVRRALLPTGGDGRDAR